MVGFGIAAFPSWETVLTKDNVRSISNPSSIAGGYLFLRARPSKISPADLAIDSISHSVSCTLAAHDSSSHLGSTHSPVVRQLTLFQHCLLLVLLILRLAKLTSHARRTRKVPQALRPSQQCQRRDPSRSSKAQKSKAIRQTFALRLICLKQAKETIMEQEKVEATSATQWT